MPVFRLTQAGERGDHEAVAGRSDGSASRARPPRIERRSFARTDRRVPESGNDRPQPPARGGAMPLSPLG